MRARCVVLVSAFAMVACASGSSGDGADSSVQADSAPAPDVSIDSARDASGDGLGDVSGDAAHDVTTDAPIDSSAPLDSTSDAPADACTPEICDLKDDDCNGACDDLLGCRVGVTRSFASSIGQHFYTTTDSEASCCGYSIEQQYAFYLYASALPGLVPLYRCLTAKGHAYTTDATCGGATVEGPMGFVATSAVCGSVPLFELVNATSGDHLYTTSAAEVTGAESGGYALSAASGGTGVVAYVWPGDCGGSSCTWSSPIAMRGSTRTSKTGFPTAWYGFPISGTKSFASIKGSVTIDQTDDLYSEVLFIVQQLPSGACTSGPWPSSTPEYGPPGAQGLAQFIVKAPTHGTFTVPIDLTLAGDQPMSNCILLGLNGGPVSTPHDVVSSADLTLSFVDTPSSQSILGAGGEFCFGQNWGCQAATVDDSKSFAIVTPITKASSLVALFGDISDSTFDGTSGFGAPPAGAWTANNDFYVYHGSECSTFGVASGPAGPGDYYATIPSDAQHLLSVPLSGSGIGVAQSQVYQSFTGVSLAAGDCLVTLFGLTGGGGFDDETQVNALVAP